MASEPFLDASVVQNGQSDGGFPDSSCTDEGDRSEALREVDNLPDQFIASETCSWERRRWFAGRDAR